MIIMVGRNRRLWKDASLDQIIHSDFIAFILYVDILEGGPILGHDPFMCDDPLVGQVISQAISLSPDCMEGNPFFHVDIVTYPLE